MIEAVQDLIDGFYEKIEEEPALWEKIGRVTLYSMEFIAFSACSAAFVRKKRAIMVISPLNQIPQQIQIQEAQETPTAPQCTPEEKKKIEELFNAIAQHEASLGNPLTALRNPLVTYNLYKLGNEIKHVHPFALLLTVPRDSMSKILLSQNRFTISNVLNGIKEGIEREGTNLERTIPPFAIEMKKDPEEIKRLIETRDWKRFAHYLFDIPGAHEG